MQAVMTRQIQAKIEPDGDFDPATSWHPTLQSRLDESRKYHDSIDSLAGVVPPLNHLADIRQLMAAAKKKAACSN